MPSTKNHAVKLPLIALLAAAHALAQNPAASVTVDANANRHPINPNIYGIAYGNANDMVTLNAPLNRWGGNSTSRYNWQIDAHSAGADWYFETYSDGSGAPSGSADNYAATTRSAGNGAEPMFTIPMIDHLANLGPSRSTLAGFSVKKYGAQTATDPWNSDAGNGVSSATVKNITGNDPLDTGLPNSASIQQNWVMHFVNTFHASTNPTGIKYYILDNEPSLWHSTHRDVHPNPSTYDEMYNKIVAYATAIRAADPGAKILGFEEWSWWAMYSSGLDQANGSGAANSDYKTHNNSYYYPWLLQKLYAYKQATGTQLLDILTVHCYNATPSGSDDSLAAQKARNAETRILWDPNFQDPSWYGDIGINGRVLNWIPTLKAMVSQYYPGLQIGCTEYNWGDEANLNGATTQADVLGIYGREGFDLATRWTVAKNTSQTPATYYVTHLASQIYRNYDGNNSTFGDASVLASAANPDNLSAFAAVRSSDGAMTLMVINKQQGSTPVTVSLANFATAGTAQAWQINSASQTSIAHLADVAVAGNSISLTVPSQSITLLVIPAGNKVTPPAQPTGLTGTVGNGTITLTWNASSGAASYAVKRATVAGGPYSTLGTVSSASPLSYADSGLANGETYYYVVSASNTGGTSKDSTELAATPIAPPTFTSSASASPNPVTQGAGTTITATVACVAGTLSNGVVQLLVTDPGGTTSSSQSFTGQNFTAGQSHAYTLAFAPAVSGTFHVQVTVLNATSQQLHWNGSAASITVTAAPLAASIGSCSVFPSDNIWNTPIDQLPASPNSTAYINRIGAGSAVHADFGSGLWDGGPIGIPYITVPGTQTKYPATFLYADESDPGPYAIPLNAPIEGGSQSTGDRHTIAVDTDNCILYELGNAYPQAASWQAGAGAIFNLRSDALRPATWTSTDAAGLPIFAGLVRYDEIAAGEILHAVRFTAPSTQRAYVWPARHYASSITDTTYPPMGVRVRLKASYDTSGFSVTNQIILRALKKYGMMLADNGSAWYISGAPDSRWDNDDLHQLGTITGSAFEVVDVSSLIVNPDSGQALQNGASVLTVSKTHSGNFTQRETQATYVVTVSNGGSATTGTVTVTETVPAGLTLVSMAGTGWTCPGTAANNCTRNDTLNGGASYPAITVTVNVTANATSPQINVVTVTGGSSPNASTSDTTIINQPPQAVSVSPASGSGLQQSFTLHYSDGAGATDLSTMFAWFSANSSSAVNSCLVEYSRPANTLYLLNDAGSAWSSKTLGSAGSLANRQCSINTASTAISLSGTDLLLTLPVTFASGFVGAKNVNAYAAGSSANSGWQTLGTWTVPSSVVGVNAVSVSPTSGSGLQQTFTLHYSDGAGATDLSTMFVWFNATSSTAANSCMVEYSRPANTLYLLNDAGTAWTSIVVGASGTFSNSQCSINAASTGVSLTGTDLLLTLPVTFGSTYAGAKNVNAYAAGASANSGWQTLGTWTVPSTVVGVNVVSVSPSSGSALQQSFVVHFSDGSGATDLSTMFVWFSSPSGAAVNSCLIEYYRSANTLYLLNDAGSAWPSMTVGASGALSNSQCSINAATATVNVSGTDLQLTLPVTFASAYGGAKNINVYAAGSSANSGWQTLGTWSVPASVSAVSVSPASGSGMQSSFAVHFSDGAGATDLATMFVWIQSASGSAVSSCLMEYYQPTNTLYLLNDGGTAWPSTAVGGSGQLSNSQCGINAAATTVSVSGNDLTLTVPVTFTSGYRGAKSVNAYAAGSSANSGWQTLGAWTVQ